MTTLDRRLHDRALERAAAAVDFVLPPVEAAELHDHLAGCARCTRTAASLRGDATVLRGLRAPMPSRRIDIAVAAALAGERRRTSPSRMVLLVAATLLLLMALLGLAAVGASILRQQLPLVVVPSPSIPAIAVIPSPEASASGAPASPSASLAPAPTPSPSAGPTPSAAPSPSAGPTPFPIAPPAPFDPATAGWTPLGRVSPTGAADDASITGIVGFDRGYAAIGEKKDLGPVAWYSVDGTNWTAAPIANRVTNCPGWGLARNDVVPDAKPNAIAANGSEIVIVGEEAPHDAAACANIAASVRPVAWHSPDGRTWQRSAPFEVGGTNSRATAVWAIPGGWQAAVQGAVTGTIATWESIDGLAWHQIGEPVAVGDVNVYAGAAPDGTVVLSRWADMTSGLRLFTSRDGRAWEAIATAGGCEKAPGVTQVAGPAAQGLDGWVLLGDMRLCASPNLSTWSTTKFDAALSVVAQTRNGAIALGDACYGAGVTCAPDPRAWLSVNGVDWAPIAPPRVYWGWTLADGPAGVLLVGSGTADGGAPTVWALGTPADPPPGDAPPAAPTSVAARTTAMVCPGASSAGKARCVSATFSWTPAAGTAIYRIYEDSSGAGVGAACHAGSGALLATTPANATSLTVEPISPVAGSGERCFYVAAANAAGESPWVRFPGKIAP
jgi:hypothetical protein